MTNEIKMNFQDGEVLYNTDKKTWSYKGINEEHVKNLTPELYAKINKALEKEVEAYQERVNAEKEAKKQADLLEKKKEVEEFKKLFNATCDCEGYDLKFHNPETDRWGNTKDVFISKNKVGGNINYDNSVSFGKWGMYSSRTKVPWKVEFDYKNRRYGTLAKACASLKKQIDEKLESIAYRNKLEEKKNNRRATLKDFFAQHGLTFKVTNKYNRYSRKGYDVEMVEVRFNTGDDEVIVTGEVNSKSSTDVLDISIRNFKINGKLETYQFKEIFEVVKTKLGGNKK